MRKFCTGGDRRWHSSQIRVPPVVKQCHRHQSAAITFASGRRFFIDILTLLLVLEVDPLREPLHIVSLQVLRACVRRFVFARHCRREQFCLHADSYRCTCERRCSFVQSLGRVLVRAVNGPSSPPTQGTTESDNPITATSSTWRRLMCCGPKSTAQIRLCWPIVFFVFVSVFQYFVFFCVGSLLRPLSYYAAWSVFIMRHRHISLGSIHKRARVAPPRLGTQLP